MALDTDGGFAVASLFQGQDSLRRSDEVFFFGKSQRAHENPTRFALEGPVDPVDPE